MNQRYLKVLALYVVSTIIPNLLYKNSERKYIQWMTKTAIGYTVFASGLKQMTKNKQRRKSQY